MGQCPFYSTSGSDGGVDCKGSTCHLYKGDDCVFLGMGADLDGLFLYLKHMHDSHQDFHFAAHLCEQVPATCGLPATDNFIPRIRTPYASVLMSEYFNSEDLDNNGKKYGRDFIIADSEDKPSQLKALEKYPDFVRPSVEVAWSDMLAWWREGASNPLS